MKKQNNNKKVWLIGYRKPSIKLYTPKRNKVKFGLLIGFVVGCLITPFSNWLIFVVGGLLNKFAPLWLYR